MEVPLVLSNFGNICGNMGEYPLKTHMEFQVQKPLAIFMRRNIRNMFPTLYLYFNIYSLKNWENLGKSNTVYLVVTFGPTCIVLTQ